MAHPLIFVENLYSGLQFPGHTVSADQEAADYPASRVGRASRLASNRWEPTTPNSEHNIKVQCDELRAADMVALDRESNLRGYQVILEASDDNFTTTTEIFDVTIPTVPGGHIDDLTGLVTEELAWLKRFPLDAHLYWRLRIPAMGANLVPQINGLWLGKSWQLAGPVNAPYADDDFDLVFDQQIIESMWIGTSAPRRGRVLQMNLELEDFAESEQARYHILGHYGRRRPAWVIWDPDKDSERAGLYVPQPGRMGFQFTTAWPYRSGTIQGFEHEPLLDGS